MIKLCAITLGMSLFATSAFALMGFLEDEFTNGSLKYCYYSNGVVITVKSYKLCPISIE